MTTRDTRRNFHRLLDQTWPGVRSEFVAAMRQARAGVDMRALQAAIARGDVDAAFRALRFDAAGLFKTGGSHMPLWVKGKGWIDNWHPQYSDKPRHKKRFPAIFPVAVIKLLLGKITG